MNTSPSGESHGDRRIDVHQHLVPPGWAEALKDRGLLPGGWPIPAWSAGDAMAMMDRQGIAVGMLSLTPPLGHYGEGRQAHDFVRRVNEYTAGTVAAHPERFGHLAGLPLPDVDAAMAEAAHALDVLHADGIALSSSAHGHYLGDPAYEPLWTELDRRSAVVFVHPAGPELPPLPELPVPLVDFVFDTTRTAVHMTRAGVLARHPHLKVILAHGGGFLPYAAHRFAGLMSAVVLPDRTAEDIIADLRRFHFETGLTASPTSLPSLLAFAAPGHLLYGSDWPFAPEPAGAYYTRFLDAWPHFAPGEKHDIDRGGAEALFPRLAR